MDESPETSDFTDPSTSLENMQGMYQDDFSQLEPPLPFNDILQADHNAYEVDELDIKCIYMAPGLKPIPAEHCLSNEEYLGPHNFEVSILPNDKSSNAWLYSASLNKVFMNIDQYFPVDFKITDRPEKELYVRITPQYSATKDSTVPVFRCITHYHNDSSNEDISHHMRYHIIRCNNALCQYIGSAESNQKLSLAFPLDAPELGSECVREHFKFVCKNSCPHPGMGRRLLEVIFTLEDAFGQVLGRKSLNVRICSCPKRDKKKEEDMLKQEGKPKRGSKRKLATSQPATSQSSQSSVSTISSMEDEESSEDESVMINLLGKENALKLLDYAGVLTKGELTKANSRSVDQRVLRKISEIQHIRDQIDDGEPTSSTSKGG